jgi:tetratricopeptide (TPR) repeat protein
VRDVFVSYRHSDAPVVRSLVVALQQCGLSVWFDEIAIPDFGGITDAAREGLAESKALLVFYSAHYPYSSPCQWELTLAFLAAARLGDPRRRVLVVNPEGGPSHIEPVELRDALYQSLGSADEQRIGAIADAVAAHVSELDTVLGKGFVAPGLWVPRQPVGAVRFVGRQREMWRIHSALHAHEAGMTQGVVGPGVVQVSGFGGVGKSLLAREYALRFAAAFPGGVFWLDAGGDAQIDHPLAREAERRQKLRSIAASLLDPAALEGLSPEDVEVALRRNLAGREPCLWVVDDLPAGLGADQVHMWLGSGSARTLITTRSREYVALAAEVALGVLAPEEGLEVLSAHQPPADAQELEAARELVAELGGHALALDVAGAALSYQSYIELLERYRNPLEDELELAGELRGELPTGHERSIAATLSHSIQRLDDPTRDVLRIASLLSSEPIPTQLFFAVLARADSLDQSVARSRGVRALHEVASLSLIDRPEQGVWQLHPVVARTIRLRDAPDRLSRLRTAAIAALTELLADARDPRHRDTLRPLIAHARGLTGQPKTVEEANLLSRVAGYDYAAGDYHSAAAAGTAQTTLLRELLGPRHPDTLQTMNNLAATLTALGELKAARALFEQALEARRELLGPRHPDTLQTIGNLASVARRLGDLSEARDLKTEVLAARRELLGPEHPATLSTMASLAVTLRELGDAQECRKLEEQVLATRRELLGPRHPDTLQTMNNLAVTLYYMEDLPAARSLLAEVLAARRELLGPEHPDTLQTMNNLAATERTLGELAARPAEHPASTAGGDPVEEQYRRADAAGDPDAANQLGALLYQRGDLVGAEAAFGRGDQRGQAAAATNLGILLRDRGDLAGAEAAFRRADQRGSGSGANDLGALLYTKGDLEGAAAAFRRALERGYEPAGENLNVVLNARRGARP